MIFVTVGTHDQGFDRLVRAADELANLISEEVLIQRGCTEYLPVYAHHFRYTDSQTMNRLIQQANVVISQASAGTIINILSLQKPLIVVPRLKKFKENWTDHQAELAKALQARKIAFAILSENFNGFTLKEILTHAHQLSLGFDCSRGQLIQALRKQLDIWAKQLA